MAASVEPDAAFYLDPAAERAVRRVEGHLDVRGGHRRVRRAETCRRGGPPEVIYREVEGMADAWRTATGWRNLPPGGRR